MIVYEFSGKSTNIEKLTKEIAICGIDECKGITLYQGLMSVYFENPLPVSGANLLEQIYQVHTVSDPQAVVQNRIQAAMEFGKSIIIEFGATNVLSNKTTSEIAAITDRLSKVQLLLLSGSLYTAIDEITDAPVDEVLTQQTKDYFLNKIKKYLGII